MEKGDNLLLDTTFVSYMHHTTSILIWLYKDESDVHYSIYNWGVFYI